MSFSPPPLTGIRALELAGLAPGPFCGILLADYGATVLRIDRPTPDAHTEDASPTHDRLTRHKSSIAVSLKSPAGIALFKSLVANVDVIIDPFRPGVLERLGLGPKDVLLKINPRLIVARMTGYRRDGKYKDMAGHDINYIAVSGVLSMLGRVDQKPYPPGNIVGDFAGGGAVCFMGILLALFARERSGRGQVVEANMVDGSAYLASFPRLMMKTPMWHKPRGENVLDGGAPFYDTYETKDGKYMSVGAIEPQFYAELLKGLELKEDEVPDRADDENWDKLREVFTLKFKEKTRAEWEKVFDDTDACCAPVLEQSELEESKYDQRPMVTLSDTPGLRIIESKDGEDENVKASRGQGAGVEGEGWSTDGLAPGAGGEAVLDQWMGWKKERQFKVVGGGLEKIDESKL